MCDNGFDYLRLALNILCSRELLELLVLLPLPPQCWEYSHVPLHWVYMVLGIEPRAPYMLCGLHASRWALYQLSYSPFRSIWLYVYQCLACIYVCAPQACLVVAEVRRKHQIPETGVIDGSEPWPRVWEPSLRPLLLTLEPSLQPLLSFRRLYVAYDVKIFTNSYQKEFAYP